MDFDVIPSPGNQPDFFGYLDPTRSIESGVGVTELQLQHESSYRITTSTNFVIEVITSMKVAIELRLQHESSYRMTTSTNFCHRRYNSDKGSY
jgi:hypothetical protein